MRGTAVSYDPKVLLQKGTHRAAALPCLEHLLRRVFPRCVHSAGKVSRGIRRSVRKKEAPGPAWDTPLLAPFHIIMMVKERHCQAIRAFFHKFICLVRICQSAC